MINYSIFLFLSFFGSFVRADFEDTINYDVCSGVYSPAINEQCDLFLSELALLHYLAGFKNFFSQGSLRLDQLFMFPFMFPIINAELKGRGFLGDAVLKDVLFSDTFFNNRSYHDTCLLQLFDRINYVKKACGYKQNAYAVFYSAYTKIPFFLKSKSWIFAFLTTDNCVIPLATFIAACFGAFIAGLQNCYHEDSIKYAIFFKD